MKGRTRILLAAALLAASLGLGWEATSGSEGYLTSGYLSPGYTSYDADGYSYYTPGTYTAGIYVAGTPDGAARGFEGDARVVLVPAVLALLVAARRRTRITETLVGVVAVAVWVVAIRAAVDGQVAGALVGSTAVGIAWSARRRPAPTPRIP